MSGQDFAHPRRPSWRVVRAMKAELRRQQKEGALGSCGPMDSVSRLKIEGTIDLAALAFSCEQALRAEFGL